MLGPRRVEWSLIGGQTQHSWRWLHAAWYCCSQEWSCQFQYSSVAQCVRLFATPRTTARQASLSITNSWSLLKLMSIESVMPFSHLILCHPLLLLLSVFASIRVFSNESVLRIRWQKYWSFSFNVSPSKEYSGLISLRMDWLDLFAVWGTLKSLLQHHRKAKDVSIVVLNSLQPRGL